jgi:hypothetical protein
MRSFPPRWRATGAESRLSKRLADGKPDQDLLLIRFVRRYVVVPSRTTGPPEVHQGVRTFYLMLGYTDSVPQQNDLRLTVVHGSHPLSFLAVTYTAS